ncbi:ABC transporter permease [Microbacterium sp.]|uniref:ABC transporter permease n=1 Tax=Microbacterium sp. TaxID=51671 RepID=UPI00333FCB77
MRRTSPADSTATIVTNPQSRPTVRVGPSRIPPVRRRGRNVPAAIAVGTLILLVLGGVIGPLFLPDPAVQQLSSALQPPAWMAGGSPEHLLGTDHLGRDELARAAVGIRTSLLTSVVATLVGGAFGVLVGMIAGFYRGWVDEVIMRISDIQMSIPNILLVLTIVTVLRPSLASIIFVLALSAWVLFARVARAETLSLRERDVVLAARGLGANDMRILLRHLLPNISGPLLVIATFEIATLIIAESSLGYLGLGVPPPTPTLGAMISAGQEGLTAGVWWPVVVPGVVIAAFIMSVNVLGDWMRDRLDPHEKTRR